MTARSNRPLLAGALGAVALVVIVLVARTDPGASSQSAAGSIPLPASTASSAATSVATAGPSANATSPSRAIPFLTPTDQPSLRALGSRLVTAPDSRPVVTGFEVQTASYADGSVFSAPGEGSSAITVVFFMAAWCPTCGPEAVALRDLHEQYGDQGLTILILDVDQDETEEDLARFREQTGSGEHLWAMDRDFGVARALEVNTLDATVVIDQRGRIAYRDGSPTDYGTLAAVVEALLDEGS